MKLKFIEATLNDSELIGSLVIQLTTEICELTHVKHFNIDLDSTVQRYRKLFNEGHYAAILAFSDNKAIAVATITETYALYAGGKIGLIQEFYVLPEYRTTGVGSKLMQQVKDYGLNHNWSCIELCTPPLPEFERTLNFYQKNGLTPVGGRKMRQDIGDNND
ncbi:MAG: GNAT family N-acetyltransferase [Gammaproteobacteria bacterium]|nr:MAG: GNAT family N-acetyltransferase [Gammaproteobacteria bacterium]